MRKGRSGTHLKLLSSLIDALENCHDTSFLCLVVRDLPAEPLVAQLLQFLQFFFKDTKLSYGCQLNLNKKTATLPYERVYKSAFLSSLWCPTIQFLLQCLQLGSRRM